MVDQDGDIFSYNIYSNYQFTQNTFIQTGFSGSSAYLCSGDYDGDNVDDIAVLLHSIEDYDITPYYRLVVFNLFNNQLNIIFDNAFIDASGEFNNNFRRAENSIRLFDIDSDDKDELLLFTFPYAYIFKYKETQSEIISYKENINSNSIFIGDLNKNGVVEIAFPYSNRINFVEFETNSSNKIPYNISGYSISSQTIQLQWDGSSDQYYIYRGENKNNLILIDSTIQKIFTDTNVSSNKSYFYKITSSSILDGGESNPSNIIEVYSHEPAKPVSVTNNSSNSLIVTFSERIKTTIDNLGSFFIPGIGIPNSISPYNQFSYLLTFDNDLMVGPSLLIISDLRDYYNSPLVRDSLEFIVDPAFEELNFYVTTFKIIDPYRIKITFNYNVDQNSAANVLNYIFKPENRVTSVQFDPADPKSIYLDLTYQKPVGSIGREYVLNIENVFSDAASGNIKITNGAGSYLVLTSFAKDLSDVYAYPNPVKSGTGITKVTFANLPQKSKITIFTIDGKHIIDLEESDGNGGVDYNLLDSDGNPISTGIYIYRVVQLNEQNEEGEEKLGKFAVIK
jgi:hypothetical protein